jgi:MerR family transcriptional regulator/heat shock protein HspR
MKTRRKKGYFSISAVAKMFEVHQQTIRLYEKQGLITPKRSEGNTRLFSEEDIDQLEEVIHLTHDLGINLAGVEMILKLKKQISKMQKDMNKMFETTQEELNKQVETSKASIQSSAQRLLSLKQEKAVQGKIGKITPVDVEVNSDDSEESVENWEITFDED